MLPTSHRARLGRLPVMSRDDSAGRRLAVALRPSGSRLVGGRDPSCSRRIRTLLAAGAGWHRVARVRGATRGGLALRTRALDRLTASESGRSRRTGGRSRALPGRALAVDRGRATETSRLRAVRPAAGARARAGLERFRRELPGRGADRARHRVGSPGSPVGSPAIPGSPAGGCIVRQQKLRGALARAAVDRRQRRAGGARPAGSRRRTAGAARERRSAAAIAQLMLRHEVGPLPAGRFVLARGDDGLEVRSGVLPRGRAGDLGVELSRRRPLVELHRPRSDRRPGSLSPLGGGGGSDSPRRGAAARRRAQFQSCRASRSWSSSAPPNRPTVSGGRCAGRRRARAAKLCCMVPWFERHLPRPGGRGAWLGRAGRLVPGGERADARAAGPGSLEKLPLIPAAEVQRIAAATRLLAPFQDCTAIAFEVWHEPEGGAAEALFAGAWSGSGAGGGVGCPLPEDGEIDEAPPIR